MISQIVELPDRAIIKISGADRIDFLQNIVTADLVDMKPQDIRYSALLSPQGKVLFDFFICQNKDEFWLDVAAPAAEELVKRLTMYKLRADVHFENASNKMGVFASLGSSEFADDVMALSDPRNEDMGQRLYTRVDQNGCASFENYQANRIKCGVPEAYYDFDYGDVFPHDINMDVMGGVAFSKGCFVGQEVVSRVKHRGSARKRIIPVNGKLPDKGTPLLADGREVGIMGSSASHSGLALMRIDKVQDALQAKTPITDGHSEIICTIPNWAKT